MGRDRILFLKLMVMLLILAITMVAGCTQNDQTLEDIVFMAGYKPQANLPFVGVYIADKKGYFKEQGLNVDIKHSASGEHVKLLLSGDIQFSTSDAGSVLKQTSSSSAPITAIALLGQRGQQGYMSLVNSQINSLKD